MASFEFAGTRDCGGFLAIERGGHADFRFGSHAADHVGVSVMMAGLIVVTIFASTRCVAGTSSSHTVCQMPETEYTKCLRMERLLAAKLRAAVSSQTRTTISLAHSSEPP